MSVWRTRGWQSAAGALCAAWLASGCGKQPVTAKPPAEEPAAPRIEDMSAGPIKLVMRAEPGRVEYQRDLLLTITLTAPSSLKVEFPPIEDRVQGFTVYGTIAEDPVTEGDRTTWELRSRLMPEIASEHRLAPMAIKVLDQSHSPAETVWIATRPLVFETASPVKGDPGSDVSPRFSPVWIAPSARTVAAWLAGAAALAAAFYGLYRLLRRVRREVALRRMSPRERALLELQELLARGLPSQDRVKAFYLELTMIVRRYIERRHGIRAPEQTTEEFLGAVRSDPRFPHDVLARLAAFLEAADLVKFAAHRPTQPVVEAAAGTARDYIETDARQADGPEAGSPPAGAPG